MTKRLTTAQAIISFLKNQYTERDGKQQRFFEGCLGIFGHGNVAGIGQALEQDPSLPYYLFRNEQAMVHTAAAFAKTSFRMRTLACTASIGPGATRGGLSPHRTQASKQASKQAGAGSPRKKE